MLTSKDNSKTGNILNIVIVTLMKQGDIHNPESITSMYHYHRSIFAFVFYNLTGERPIKNPLPKVLTPTILMPLPCLRLDNGIMLPMFQRKTYF